MSPGLLLLSTSQVSMRLSAEALSAPRYAISKNNLQEKMSRAFPDRGVQQQTDYQRQNRGTMKNIKIAGKMLVNVFDMLGTSSNEVRAVRRWFQQKTNIKYASVTGKLLLLFLRNQTLHSITGKVIAMPNRIVSSTDRLSILYVLNDLFQRTQKSSGEKTRSPRDSTGDESSNTTRSNTLTHNDGSNMVGRVEDSFDENGTGDKSMSCKYFFDYRKKWENVIPAIVGECKQGLSGEDLKSWERVIHVWSEKRILPTSIFENMNKYIVTKERKRSIGNSSAAELKTKVVDMQRKSLFAQPYRRDIAALHEPMPMRSGIRNDALRQSGPNRCDNEHFGFSNYRKNATLRKRKDHAPFERDEYVHNKKPRFKRDY